MFARFLFSARGQRVSKQAFASAGKANQAAAELRKLFCFDGAFAFWRAKLHTRDQLAKIAVSLRGSNQQRIAPSTHATYFRTDVRLNICFFCGQMKTRRAIKPVTIEQRHGWHAM